MKSFALLGVAIFSIANARRHPSNKKNLDLFSATSKDLPAKTHRVLGDEPWEIGTKVYDEFDDGWYVGEITGYSHNTLVYAVTWPSKDTDTYRYDEIDEVVAAAADEDRSWEIGTVVYKQFNSGWSVGKITRYDVGSDTYTVTWPDKSAESYSDDDVDSVVFDPSYIPDNSNSSDDDPWEIGTKVYDEFDDGWYVGEITGYDENTLLYTVTWSSKDTDTYRYDEIDEVVAAAADEDRNWEIGTVVYKQFNNRWSVGKITRYDAGNDTYTVTWPDSSAEAYADDDVDSIAFDPSYIPDISSNGDPWELGTQVYDEFDDGWYVGEITDYDKNTLLYTVTWSSKDTDTYRYDEIDEVVAAAADEDRSWEIGTVVYKQFNDRWSVGKITRYDAGNDTYTVTWSDTSAKVYSDDDVDSMIFDTSYIPDNSSDNDPWEIGTKVYDEFDDGWYVGTITNYDRNTLLYTVTWSSKDTVVYRYDEIDEIVAAAADEDRSWEIGTVVYKQSWFNNGWSVGKVTQYDAGSDTYTVTWEDESLEMYNDDDIDTMVLGYHNRQSPEIISHVKEDGISVGLISLLTVSCIFIVILAVIAARALITPKGEKGKSHSCSDSLELASNRSDNIQPEFV